MKIIIVGESGSGKDTILSLFKQVPDWHIIISRTTRPRREGEPADAYIFSTEQDYLEQNAHGRIFEEIIFNYNRYWTLSDDYIHESWVIITETAGAFTLKDRFPDAFILYVKTDRAIRIERAGIDRVNRDATTFSCFPCDYVIENNGDKQELVDRLKRALTHFSYIQSSRTSII